MHKIVSEIYKCEVCDMIFKNETDCKNHEETHMHYYKHAPNKTIADALYTLSDSAYGYGIGSTAMGIPISNFKSLLNEAAKRLEDK